ncbi:hypothetical protein PYCC9005_004429 [Savitreella phatthalungensis]
MNTSSSATTWPNAAPAGLTSQDNFQSYNSFSAFDPTGVQAGPSTAPELAVATAGDMNNHECSADSTSSSPHLMPSAAPRKTRNTDGCLPCKTARVKCDRGKPACGGCQRRGDSCTYNRIQFNTINSTKHDKRTGRRAKVKPGMPAPSSILVAPPARPIAGQIYTSRATPRSNRSKIGAPAYDDSRSVTTNESATITPMSEISEPDWHPFEQWTNHDPVGVVANNERRRSITIPDIMQDYTAGGAACHEDVIELRRADQALSATDNMMLSLTMTMPLSSAVSRILRDPSKRVLFDHYVHQTCSFLHPAESNPTARNPSLKYFLPLALADADVLSGVLALSATQLAAAARRVSLTGEDKVAEEALAMRDRSLNGMKRLVESHSAEQAEPLAMTRMADNRGYQGFSVAERSGNTPSLLKLIAGVLAQISLAVVDHGDNWLFHVRAARSLVAHLTPEMLTSGTERYLRARVLKYSCFAEIAMPTTEPIDLTAFDQSYIGAGGHSSQAMDIDDDELDVHFGAPARGIKLAVMISRLDHDEQLGFSAAASRQAQRALLDAQMREYVDEGGVEAVRDIAGCVPMFSGQTTDWRLVKRIWRATVALLYDRTLARPITFPASQPSSPTRHGEAGVEEPLRAVDSRASARALTILELVSRLSPASPYATALALPSHVAAACVGPTASMRMVGPTSPSLMEVADPFCSINSAGQPARSWLSRHLAILSEATRTKNFVRVSQFANLVWQRPELDTMRGWRALALEHGFIILAA